MLTVFTLWLTVGLVVTADPSLSQSDRSQCHYRRSPPQDAMLTEPTYGQPQDEAVMEPTSGRSTPDPLIDIFPPKYYPGDVLNSTDCNTVDRALDEVMKSGDLLHDRRCAVGVANKGKALLSSPTWAMTSGGTHSAPPKKVHSGQTALNLFLKTKWTVRGSSGVLSYDIAGTNHKVVVMWDTPFDRNLYKVKFNMKVYEKYISTDKALAKHLKHDGGPFRPNSWHYRTEYGVKMEGTITDNTHSKLTVFINADGFDANGGYDLTPGCAYHPGKVRKYCTLECYGGGWCWVRYRCSSVSVCTTRRSCWSGCHT